MQTTTQRGRDAEMQRGTMHNEQRKRGERREKREEFRSVTQLCFRSIW